MAYTWRASPSLFRCRRRWREGPWKISVRSSVLSRVGKRAAHEALRPAHLPRANRGQASRRRFRVALGWPSASLKARREIRAQILARARWKCQASSLPTYRLEVHHVPKRAQGSSDFDLNELIALCRNCYARTDAPFRQGRLVITPLGEARFGCELRRGNK